jgi:hypothetical protein
MKKIIDGRLCNTETAKELGIWNNDLSHSDFDWCAESLYLTRAGQYFVHGRGGARSRYAERVEQNTWSGGESIYLVSRIEAMKWAETHLDADEYATLFGEPAEAGDGTADLIVGIPVALKERLRVMAQELGVSMTAIVVDALNIHLG